MQSICIEKADQSSDRQRLSYWFNGVGEDEDDSLRRDPYSSFWNANYTPPELIPHMGFNPEMVQEFGLLISGNGTHRICAEEVQDYYVIPSYPHTKREGIATFVHCGEPLLPDNPTDNNIRAAFTKIKDQIEFDYAGRG
ncbi:uncharacterized protein BCR38DRAFT_443342, partial [Pseudomassariella vexata]